MEWLTSIRTAIDYMEKHLTDDISAQDVADQVYLSPFFLQRGFSLRSGNQHIPSLDDQTIHSGR